MSSLLAFVILAAVAALGFAAINFSSVKKLEEGTPRMQEIAKKIREGAKEIEYAAKKQHCAKNAEFQRKAGQARPGAPSFETPLSAPIGFTAKKSLPSA